MEDYEIVNKLRRVAMSAEFDAKRIDIAALIAELADKIEDSMVDDGFDTSEVITPDERGD